MEKQDADIVDAVLAGDTNAYAELVRRYQSGLLGLCSFRLRNRAQAEEAVQESFLKAYRSLKNFRKDASFKTWITRIAMNHCTDLNRTERFRSFMFRKHMNEKNEADLRLERVAPSIEASQALRKALGELSENYREIILLREFQGFSYGELSEVFNCSLDSVKARLSRARQELEEAMRPLLKEGGGE